MKGLTADIRAKASSIASLDKQVAAATRQRKEEHQDYMENLQANNAAKEILGMAKVRLAKFYDSKSRQLLQIKTHLQNTLPLLKRNSVQKTPLGEMAKARLEGILDQSPVSFVQ